MVIFSLKTYKHFLTIGLCGLPSIVAGQDIGGTYSQLGTQGLIDMPSASSAPDGELALSTSYTRGQLRNTLTFQITPRLSGSFRYSVMYDYGGPNRNRYDRSFDLHYRFLDEGKYRPAVALGLRDLVGTGIYSSEYIVATKSIGQTLNVSGGLGWGRLGSHNGFTNPLGIIDDRFETRPPLKYGGPGEGGQPTSNQWFRGDAAFFGGIEWQATEQLSLKAEYSSDAYLEEVSRGLIEHKSPFNFGLDYRVTPNTHLAAYYAYGSEIGAQLTYVLNPKNPPAPSGIDTAPTPVLPRPSRQADPQAWTTNWVNQPETHGAIESNLRQALAQEGLELIEYRYTADAIEVRYNNTTYWSEAQAIGRAARAMTRGLPTSVETFTLVPVVNGMATSATTLKRSDLEELENAPDASWRSYTRADIRDGASLDDDGLYQVADVFPRLTWGFGPYFESGLFDPDAPFRYDLGAELSGTYEPAPGILFSGSLRQKIIGNLDESTRVSDSVLPHVRSDAYLYAKTDSPKIPYLTGEYFERPATDIYTRVTAGLLEPMFAGISGEVLWKPIDSRLALGLEVNYVQQRDYDQLFGLRDYTVATGHASAYYTFSNGFYAQVDAGRYLAGDWGGTLSVAREFNNGWKIGAYATLTDVSAEDFGEGSFDKGITIEIPMFWALGKPTKDSQKAVIQPLTRDGGARLKVNNRLFELVDKQGEPNLSSQWGRFWR